MSDTRGRRLLTAMAAALALTVLAGACGSSKAATPSSSDQSSASEGTPVDGGSLVFGVAAETSGWNPHTNQWGQYGAMVGSSVLEPLATMGPDNGAKPFLATVVDRQRHVHQLADQPS